MSMKLNLTICGYLKEWLIEYPKFVFFQWDGSYEYKGNLLVAIIYVFGGEIQLMILFGILGSYLFFNIWENIS